MNDGLGIEICCEKCRYAIWTKSMPRIFVKCEAGNYRFEYERCRLDFRAHYKALATRIFELQNDKDYLDKIAKYHADLGGASLADLLDDYRELQAKLTESAKLLEEKSFELGELQARVVAKNECIKAYKSKLVDAEEALEHRNAELEAAYEQLSNFVDNDKYPELYADFQTNAKALAESLKRVEKLEKELTTAAGLLEEKSFEIGKLQARVQLAERKEICVKENAEKLGATKIDAQAKTNSPEIPDNSESEVRNG